MSEHLKRRIERLLIYEKLSPEFIAKRLAKESEFCLSHETIYQWIWMVTTEVTKTIKSLINICVTQGVGKSVKT